MFSLSIYLKPLYDTTAVNAEAGEGKLVWQKYNCQSCHQVYGLGGYLGPDLTNVVSEKGKGQEYVIGMVRSGTKQMPAFEMSGREERLLLKFLGAADASGNADPRNFYRNASGMIERK